MGLDSYWRHPQNTNDTQVVPDPVFDPPLQLCGGLFSDHGSGSFRGKVYAELVRDVTGVSLYADRIPNTTVSRMADALSAGFLWIPTNPEEHDLVRMFRAYADAGFDLHGWW